ncbi:hypothetical protein XH99_29580 [Bradyrhizobium nanningense]|uniref:Uncharacterized protein n=1 Tax=Bradyrhizobium nanningense TaxID=1325118 RepID=A0A4Q0RWM6_9BRAD|nr:hypothetical protein [Bradyrhizobium nanningense]RXH24213.1 hypothetical protein XH99_29580 [Bradyrhizobium nanningense]RXH29231.1 hypothetical protein XH84_22205 [Bradyrhizobium nanningense]
MAGIVKDWQIELIEAHRGLFCPPAGNPGAALGYPRCEGGWRDLIQRLCVRLEAALGDDERIHLDRIREAVGRLRVSWRGQVMPATICRIHEAIALAEARSACTCELCGEPGRLYLDDGVCMARCAAHARGTPLADESEGNRMHIVRMPRCDGSGYEPRRYDRENDNFVDPPPDEEE